MRHADVWYSPPFGGLWFRGNKRKSQCSPLQWPCSMPAVNSRYAVLTSLASWLADRLNQSMAVKAVVPDGHRAELPILTGAEEESIEYDGVIIVCEAGHSRGDGSVEVSGEEIVGNGAVNSPSACQVAEELQRVGS